MKLNFSDFSRKCRVTTTTTVEVTTVILKPRETVTKEAAAEKMFNSQHLVIVRTPGMET